MSLQIDSANGAIILSAKDGAGNVSVEIPRVGAFTNGKALFAKTVRGTRLFTTPSAGAISTAQDFYTSVADAPFFVASGTSLVMPTLVAGTDYAFYLCSDGTMRADSNFTAPSGYTTATSRFLGCGHYAPGGNATGRSGGNTTPAFNPYSLFDLTYRPRRKDWRGMTTDPGEGFCGMIYMLNTEHIANGPSAYNKVIADGSSPPKIPTQFGGSGSNSYSDLNWWTAGEVLAAYGLRHPTYQEYAALAFGTTEASSIGTDQGSTILNAAYTSRCGIIQASGVMWIWGANFGGGAAGASWTANTGGRGSTYQMENAVLLGGYWAHGSNCGSRASSWVDSPTYSSNSVAARGVCDLLILD